MKKHYEEGEDRREHVQRRSLYRRYMEGQRLSQPHKRVPRPEQERRPAHPWPPPGTAAEKEQKDQVRWLR